MSMGIFAGVLLIHAGMAMALYLVLRPLAHPTVRYRLGSPLCDQPGLLAGRLVLGTLGFGLAQAIMLGMHAAR